MEHGTIKGKKHYVFEDYEEFVDFTNLDIKKDDIKHWRDGIEGEWVYADDGRIVQILKVGPLNHPTDCGYKYAQRYVRTIVGSFVQNKNTTMDTDFSKHPNRYVFGAKYRDGHTRQVKRKNLTRDEQLFVSSIIPGIKDAVSAAAEAFGIDDRKKARKKAIFLLKQERVTKALAKAAKDVAKELGLDHKYVIKGFMKLHEFGEDERVALGALKELAKVIGTTGQQMRFAESGFAMFQEVDPEQIEEFADDRALAEKEIQQLEGKEEESE